MLVNKKKTLVVIFVILVILLIIIAYYSSQNNQPQTQTLGYNTQDDNFNNSNMLQTSRTQTNESKYNKYSSPPNILPENERVNKKAVLKTEKGTIEIKLFGDDAPLTVSNFIFLTNDDFYDNLTFHRREEGFVILGGDPLGQGYGGPGYQFEDEAIPESKYPRQMGSMGMELITYRKGLVAMANSGPNTNGSQFFIMLDDAMLPPAYNIFGEVVSGFDVVEKIQIGDRILEASIEEL